MPVTHTDLQLAAFRTIADEIADAVESDGYLVDVAMDTDPCFTSEQARAMLLRDIVTHAADVAASRVGIVDFRPVNGSGRELQLFVGLTDRRYRIKKASLVGDELMIRANSDSALTSTEPEEEALIRREQWVYGWSPNKQGNVDDVFIAQVLGVTAASPHWLILGPKTQLLEPRETPVTGGGFKPSDEGLPGFADDDEADETDYGSDS